MVTTEVLNPHSEVELEKSIKLQLAWFSSEAAAVSTLAVMHEHCHTLAGLCHDLQVEKLVNRTLRKNDKGAEITSPLARSWHK